MERLQEVAAVAVKSRRVRPCPGKAVGTLLKCHSLIAASPALAQARIIQG